MAESVARAKHIRVSPRKLRLVADLVRGKKVSQARDILAVMPQKGAPIITSVLTSAVANAESKAAETNRRIDADEMVITKILVDEGVTMKRGRTAPRSRFVRIRKRTSHIHLEISES